MVHDFVPPHCPLKIIKISIKKTSAECEDCNYRLDDAWVNDEGMMRERESCEIVEIDGDVYTGIYIGG